MTFPVVGSNIPSSYQISNSLRFNDDDSSYLSRTPAIAGNRKTWTWSGWVKRCETGDTNIIFDCQTASDYTFFGFTSADQFQFRHNASFNVYTPAVFRDVSAWYHIVVVFDSTQATATNRRKIYINGVLQSLTIDNEVDLNADSFINSTNPHFLGSNYVAAGVFESYMAEVHFIDGQALSHTDFGEFDEDSGIWKPKQYAGTYGTNGFYLKFNNTGNMGEDSSGNDNTWTPTNLSGTTDVTTDTPTNNFATLNALDTYNSPTLSEGNTKIVRSSGYGVATGTVAMKTGKWYWEIQCPTVTTSGENESFGISKVTANIIENSYLGINTNSWALMIDNTASDIYFMHNNSFTDSGINASNGDIFMFALDADTGKLWFGRNGTWFDSGNPSAGTNEKYTASTDDVYYVAVSMNGDDATLFNFGNPAFSISSGNSDENGYGNFEYAPPSGYLALCTQNLATELSPTIDDGSQYFNTVLYTGTGSSTSITGVGFQPDLVYTTSRSNAYNNGMFDSSRGANKLLNTNTTNAEASIGNGISSFDSDGFSFSGDAYNTSSYTFVAWNWKANAGTTSSNTDGSITSTVQANTTAGFSIVTYTGTGSNATIGHSLGKVPKMIIVKRRNSTSNWGGYHASIGNTSTIKLNSTDASAPNIVFWNNTSPTSSVFTVGTSTDLNASGGTYIAYCFAEIEGYSKFGKYTGNGSTDGTFVYTGFRPAFVIYKRTDAVENWQVLDSKRDIDNPVGQQLYPNLSATEGTENRLDFTSNGFKLRNGGTICNASGGTYIYMAFAENPFVSSSAIPVVAR